MTISIADLQDTVLEEATKLVQKVESLCAGEILALIRHAIDEDSDRIAILEAFYMYAKDISSNDPEEMMDSFNQTMMMIQKMDVNDE